MKNYLKNLIEQRDAAKNTLDGLIAEHGIYKTISKEEFIRTHVHPDVYNFLYAKNWNTSNNRKWSVPDTVLYNVQEIIQSTHEILLEEFGKTSYDRINRDLMMLSVTIDLLIGESFYIVPYYEVKKKKHLNLTVINQVKEIIRLTVDDVYHRNKRILNYDVGNMLDNNNIKDALLGLENDLKHLKDKFGG